MTYRPVAHIIGDIFDEVKTKFISTVGNPTPYYDYGTPLEIINRITEKMDNYDFSDKIYPLIWFMIEDNLREIVSPNKTNPRSFENATIVICTRTDPNYTTAQRYENTITPILRPLYELFMYYLSINRTLLPNKDKFAHNYDENLFWGREGLYGNIGNIFNDTIDAVIISRLNFSIVETC